MFFGIAIRKRLILPFIFSMVGFVICGFTPKVLAQVAPTLSISPAKYDLTVEPGQVQQVGVKLTNRSEVSLPVTTEAMDFSPADTTGGITFGQSLPNHSAKSWLSVTPSTFILEPQETKVVTVNIAPPDSLTEGSYFAVTMFQTSLPSNYFGEGDQARIVPWIGELFLLRYGNLPTLDDAALTITQFTAPKMTKKNTVPMAIEVQNNTLFHLSPKTDFALDSLFGKAVAQASTNDTTILPGTRRIFQVTLERKMPLGIYKPTATLRVANYQRELTKPPMLLMTVVGLVIVCLGIIGAGQGLAFGIKYRGSFRQRIGRFFRVIIRGADR